MAYSPSQVTPVAGREFWEQVHSGIVGSSETSKSFWRERFLLRPIRRSAFSISDTIKLTDQRKGQGDTSTLEGTHNMGTAGRE